MPREGTVDRITDGVAVVLIEEGGETVDELHLGEDSLPEGTRAGDRVRVSGEGDSERIEAAGGRDGCMEERMEKKLRRLRSRRRNSTEEE
jgi:hypothetical protein